MCYLWSSRAFCQIHLNPFKIRQATKTNERICLFWNLWFLVVAAKAAAEAESKAAAHAQAAADAKAASDAKAAADAKATVDIKATTYRIL